LQTIPLQPGEYHVYLSKNIVNAVTTPVTDIDGPGDVLAAAVYPNPAMAGSVLRLTIPAATQVNAELQTMQGQAIRTVFSGRLSAGEHRVSLTDKINNLAAGIYMLKINSGRQHQYIKILIP
jgi:hypothetical protein